MALDRSDSCDSLCHQAVGRSQPSGTISRTNMGERTARRTRNRLTVAGLFAGIGGIERDFTNPDTKQSYFARSTLALQMCSEAGRAFEMSRKPPMSTIRSLPNVGIVVAGFPCQGCHRPAAPQATESARPPWWVSLPVARFEKPPPERLPRCARGFGKRSVVAAARARFRTGKSNRSTVGFRRVPQPASVHERAAWARDHPSEALAPSLLASMGWGARSACRSKPRRQKYESLPST